MELRQVGTSGLRVSSLTLGTMTWASQVDDYEAKDQLTTFLDAGGTTLDLAPIYGDGAAEALVGRLLADTGARDQMVLAGKAGVGIRGGEASRDASRGALLDQLDRTLTDLRTDHLDLWQVHTPDPAVRLEETMTALEHAVASGRVRYVGVSNFRGWQMGFSHVWLAARAAGLPLICNQVEYSLVNRGPELEVVDAARYLGMGVLAYSPLGRGVLTGKYRDGRIPGDSRAADPHWEEFVGPYLRSPKLAIVEALARAADGLGVSMSHLALAWLLRRPQVSAAIVGARTSAQLADSLQAVTLEVPDEIVDALDDVSQE